VYQLVVDGGHLRQGLRWYEKTRKIRAADKALISFDRSFMQVEALDYAFVARADGAWPGTAKVSATVLAALAKAPPTSEDVQVSFGDGKLRIGRLAVTCTWEPVSGVILGAPAASDWIAALSLKYRIPRPQIVLDGLAPKVADAERQLGKLVARCAKSLAPLHVTEADLHEMIERRLIEHAQVNRGPDEAARQNVGSLVAWVPPPGMWPGANVLGAVMMPPGVEVKLQDHRDALADKVQAMLEAEDDPEAALAWASEELQQVMPVGPPEVRWAGRWMMDAMEGWLREIGALTAERGRTPTTNDPEASLAIKEMTLEEWVNGISPSNQS